MFLAFPLNDKPDWRHPPWMTIVLILANLLVFFGPQSMDMAAADRATGYYLGSELPRLELPRYAEYLRNQRSRESGVWADRVQAAVAAGEFEKPYLLMRNDLAFLAKLNAGQIIRPGEREYPRWREQRARYEAIRGAPFTERWALNPADWQPVTTITSVFLHGSVAHLLGNMVFLFLFGYTVERTIGAGRYLAFYLLAGLGGGLGDLMARWGSPIIALGASGAISGLMAMYAVLYGMQRIKFFYMLLFYFDYVTAPAIILLPAWIAHELLQQRFGNEGVAYMAHAGGLVTGALLIAWHKHRHADTKVPSSEAPPDPVVEDLARAEGYLKALRMDEARAAFARAATARPGDSRVLSQYFNLAQLKPAGEDFHRAAAMIFALGDTDESIGTLVHQSFSTYLQKARPSVQLTSEQVVRLALRFARDGHSDDAARLARVLLSRAPTHGDLPSVLLAAVHALRRKGEKESAEALARELRERFPRSAEARMSSESSRL